MESNFKFCPLLLALCFLAQWPLLAQSKLVTTKTGTTTQFTLTGLDTLTRIPGTQRPYYSYLWVFGDGKFVNGTRDSLPKHEYEKYPNASFAQGVGPSKPDVTVYMTGHYSGGARPPRKGVVAPPPPDSFFLRPPTVARHEDAVALNSGEIKDPPGPVASVFTDPNAMLRLQLNHNIMPGDTLASVVSFRSPVKPGPNAQTIDGQVLLFYNSKAKAGMSATPPLLKGLVKPPPPPPPSTRFGNFHFRQSPKHYTNVDLAGSVPPPPHVKDYKGALGWSYSGLPPANVEERNLFAEFANDTSMWQLYRNMVGDTLRFLAVLTAISQNPDLLGILPEADTSKLDPAMVSLLRDSFFTDDGFLPLSASTNGLPGVKILGFSEVVTPVVSAHDPNSLNLYACKCPSTDRRKLMGIIEFSNDGNAPTSKVKVSMKIPAQLNLESIEEAIQISPAPAPLSFSIDEPSRTATWEWLAALPSAAERGFGHPDTKGHIVFSALLEASTDLTQLEPMQACIVFDNLDPMCTQVVTDSMVITEFQGGAAGTVLECEKCTEGKTPCWCGDYCLYLIALAVLLLILLLWWLKRRSQP